jgi:hypothetical protein
MVLGSERTIEANGIPEHKVGTFPNSGNPHRITLQEYQFTVPSRPEKASQTIEVGMSMFGVAVNGVPFEPSAAEWYLGQHNSFYQYEALSGAVSLGVDENHAHVQPTGAYHYHGLPKHLLKELRVRSGTHSPIVGWAADGFPIYAMYGYRDLEGKSKTIRKLKTSYRLKKGERPSGDNMPGGKYDGTFVSDYEYVAGLGDLDECNGRDAVTPEFPEGTYAYFLTADWPVIPRFFRGEPSSDFLKDASSMGPLRESLQNVKQSMREMKDQRRGSGGPPRRRR